MEKKEMTLRHDSELKTESDAIETAVRWSGIFKTYETVEKLNPFAPFDGFPDLCFYVTNRFDPRCTNKSPGYHPEL